MADDLDILNSELPITEEGEVESSEVEEVTDTVEEVEEVEEEEEELVVPDPKQPTKVKEITKAPIEEFQGFPSIDDLIKTYPDIKARFPNVEYMLNSANELSKFFPDAESAKEIIEDWNTYDNIRSDISNGSVDTLFSSIPKNQLEVIADKILPSLHKLDPNLWHSAITPTVKSLVKNMYNEGKRRNDENLMHSAQFASDYIFGTYDVDTLPDSKPSTVSEERKKFESERTAKIKADFTMGIHSKATSQLTALIKGDGKINPNNVFSPFIQDSITQKVMSEVDQKLAEDKSYISGMTTLWKAAEKQNYSESSMNRIINAYITRAKSLIPSVRSRILSEALGTSPEEGKRKEELSKKISLKKEIGSSSVPSSQQVQGQKVTPKEVDWSKTSDLDLLNGKITRRRNV